MRENIKETPINFRCNKCQQLCEPRVLSESGDEVGFVSGIRETREIPASEFSWNKIIWKGLLVFTLFVVIPVSVTRVLDYIPIKFLDFSSCFIIGWTMAQNLTPISLTIIDELKHMIKIKRMLGKSE